LQVSFNEIKLLIKFEITEQITFKISGLILWKKSVKWIEDCVGEGEKRFCECDLNLGENSVSCFLSFENFLNLYGEKNLSPSAQTFNETKYF